MHTRPAWADHFIQLPRIRLLLASMFAAEVHEDLQRYAQLDQLLLDEIAVYNKLDSTAE